MKYVHIVTYKPAEDEYTTRATCVVSEDGAPAECSGDEGIVHELQMGVFSPVSEGAVSPADGVAFLEALGFEYKTPSLFASDVMDGNDVQPYEPPPARDLSADKAA